MANNPYPNPIFDNHNILVHHEILVFQRMKVLSGKLSFQIGSHPGSFYETCLLILWTAAKDSIRCPLFLFALKSLSEGVDQIADKP